MNGASERAAGGRSGGYTGSCANGTVKSAAGTGSGDFSGDATGTGSGSGSGTRGRSCPTPHVAWNGTALAGTVGPAGPRCATATGKGGAGSGTTVGLGTSVHLPPCSTCRTRSCGTHSPGWYRHTAIFASRWSSDGAARLSHRRQCSDAGALASNAWRAGHSTEPANDAADVFRRPASISVNSGNVADGARGSHTVFRDDAL